LGGSGAAAPATWSLFEQTKVESNVMRNARNRTTLEADGRRVIKVWERRLKKRPSVPTLDAIEVWLTAARPSLELPRLEKSAGCVQRCVADMSNI
jgi:G:T-mismatch repair DNA endonuclease (very short patch repair protein)